MNVRSVHPINRAWHVSCPALPVYQARSASGCLLYWYTSTMPRKRRTVDDLGTAGDVPEFTNQPGCYEEGSNEDVQPAVRNQFDLLSQGAEDSADAVPEDISPVAQAPVKASKKQKRNRNKKRKTAAKAAKSKNVSDWEALTGAPAVEDADDGENKPETIEEDCFRSTDGEKFRTEANEIFSSIQALAAEERAQEAASHADQMAALTSSLRVMGVEPRLLSADAEKKKLFGYNAVQAEKRADEEEKELGRGKRRGRGKKRAPRSRLNQKNALVTPGEDWSSKPDGLKMVIDKEAPASENGIRYFRYVHEGSYAKVEKKYQDLANSLNIRDLEWLAEDYPFHVASLLQIAELHREQGDHDKAYEKTERAIHVLESSWNSLFKPFQGDCRLRYEVPENKAMYGALFRYSQLLTRRGLHRTALEMAKLVLNFDPENDPMGVLMLIDSVAVLSGQIEWLCVMQRDFKLIPLDYFPNFAVSSALAVFHLQNGKENADSEATQAKKRKKKGKKGKGGGSAKEGNDSAASIASQSPAALELLTDALLAFPMVLQPLLAATMDSGSAWSSHPLFNDHRNEGSLGVLYRISRVYAERSNALWTGGKPKELLASAAQKAIALADKGGYAAKTRLAKAMRRRMDAMRWFEKKGLYRSMQIADFADGAVNLPAELLADDDA